MKLSKVHMHWFSILRKKRFSPSCDIRYDFRMKTMFGSSLPPVVCMRSHVLFTLFAFVLCPLCLWMVHFLFPLPYSLTFIYIFFNQTSIWILFSYSKKKSVFQKWKCSQMKLVLLWAQLTKIYPPPPPNNSGTAKVKIVKN